MNNPETQATFGTRHKTKTSKAKQKSIKLNNTDTNKTGVTPGARKGWAVPASYKTPVILLVWSSRVGHYCAQ